MFGDYFCISIRILLKSTLLGHSLVHTADYFSKVIVQFLPQLLCMGVRFLHIFANIGTLEGLLFYKELI